MTTRVFKTQYDAPFDAGIACTLEERMTKSEFADECDVNKIVGRYMKTGVLGDPARAVLARYGDFSSVPTFAEMHDLVLAAEDAFAQLPAAVRSEFGNDPRVFVEAAHTPEGRALLIKHGLGASEASGEAAGPSPSPDSPGAAPAASGSPSPGGQPGAPAAQTPPSPTKQGK